MHLICEFDVREASLLIDGETMKTWLKSLALAIGMTVHGEVEVRQYPYPDYENKAAISAVCFLAESSIMIHCCPELKHVGLDVFSCKKFCTSMVLDKIKAAFDPESIETLLLARGMDDAGKRFISLGILEFTEVAV